MLPYYILDPVAYTAMFLENALVALLIARLDACLPNYTACFPFRWPQLVEVSNYPILFQ